MSGCVTWAKRQICLLNLRQRHSYGRFGMMRNPVRPRFESSRAPSPQRNELPGAKKLWVCEHITNRREEPHVETTSNEVEVVLQHVCVQSSEHVSGGIAFLGHNFVDVDEAERDCGRAGKGRASQESTFHEYNHVPRVLAG